MYQKVPKKYLKGTKDTKSILYKKYPKLPNSTKKKYTKVQKDPKLSKYSKVPKSA